MPKTLARRMTIAAAAAIAMLTMFAGEARADGPKQGAGTAQVLAQQSKPATANAKPKPAAAKPAKPAKPKTKATATANAKAKAQAHPITKAKPKPAKAPVPAAKPAKPGSTARA